MGRGHWVAAVSSMLCRGFQAAWWMAGKEEEDKSMEGGEGSRTYQVEKSQRDGPGRELVSRR